MSGRIERQRARFRAAEVEVFAHYGLVVSSEPLGVADPAQSLARGTVARPRPSGAGGFPRRRVRSFASTDPGRPSSGLLTGPNSLV